MNWQIEVKPTAERQYRKLDRKTRVRTKETLYSLEKAPNPLHHKDVRALTGELHGDWRLRVGGWAITRRVSKT
ncbi:MAG: hypothetical protein C4536_02660 [Actinobacteria bacterium]|jgi:mRNA-degrading endonuclease RelE of RelBE toxin-antitoxin system|nr:MAG: hypothetical protein C4536_02660 [Actinomycetota bacterium]